VYQKTLIFPSFILVPQEIVADPLLENAERVHILVIARSVVTRQSRNVRLIDALDCRASLAMTGFS
jgi:hypothetical protein